MVASGKKLSLWELGIEIKRVDDLSAASFFVNTIFLDDFYGSFCTCNFLAFCVLIENVCAFLN